MDDFDKLTQDFEPDHREILQAGPLETAYAKLISGLGAIAWTAAVCGVLTWLGWACWLVGKWVAG